MSTAKVTPIPQPAISADFAAGAREMFLQSLEREVPVTCKVITAVPDGKRDWRPDPKSRNAWELAVHVATSDVWFLNGIADHNFSPDPPKEDPAKNIADLAVWYEKNAKAGIERVRKMAPQQLLKQIDFYGAFNLPAFAYLDFCVKHSVHHRAQLSTYLRPIGSKVPSIYGGSADEPWQGASS